jgi:hypothetical protein
MSKPSDFPSVSEKVKGTDPGLQIATLSFDGAVKTSLFIEVKIKMANTRCAHHVNIMLFEKRFDFEIKKTKSNEKGPSLGEGTF